MDELLATADADTLRQLVRKLYHGRPALELECLDFLRETLLTTKRQVQNAAGEAALLLWREAEPASDEFQVEDGPAYGLLIDLADRFENEEIPGPVRRYMLDQGVCYVDRTALTDVLYNVLYAACDDAEDLRYLAAALEGLGREWPLEHARRIYRTLGDREKYLELRLRKMVYGADYHDLATFYKECGEETQALSVAKEGLENGQGRMDELRQFLSEHALQAGDRETYLGLQFQQAVDRITVQSYTSFQRLCTDSEWTRWEPLLLAAVARARPEEKLKLYLLRRENEQAVAILSSLSYPWRYEDSNVLEAAASLEKQFPEQVLEFYRNGLGNVTVAHQRSEYARNAKVLLKMRRIWTEVMEQPSAWAEFARSIKMANQRRPALQQEFGRILPDWNSL